MRARAFVKYLPQYGWQPFVLTINDQYYLSHTRDEALVAELPDDLAVHRTNSFEPKGKMAHDFKAGVYGIQKKGLFFERLIKPVLRQIYRSFVIPDEHILWMPFAIRKGLQLIKQHHIDVILVTTPPHSAGLIAAILSRLTGKPLIWDVRDDWVGNPLFDKGPSFSKIIGQFLEDQIVQRARYIVTVTRESIVAFTKKYPGQLSGKFKFIPNGFDRQEFAALSLDQLTDAEINSSDRLRIIYIGTLGATRSPISLFKAIKQLIDESPDNNCLKLDIYGYSRADFQEISTAMGLDGVVEFHGFVSRAESLRQLLMSNAALMIIPQEEGSSTAIPGKLYEYLGAKKFVLALCNSDSAAGRLINELNLGVVCPQNNIHQVKCVLQDMLNRHKDGMLKPTLAATQLLYERSAQSELLAILLDSTLD